MSRGAAFNLEDEDDLTHYGQSLSKLDDFDNVGLDSEDDEEEQGVIFYCLSQDCDSTTLSGQIDSEVVKKTHFGGFGDEEDEEDQVCEDNFGYATYLNIPSSLIERSPKRKSWRRSWLKARNTRSICDRTYNRPRYSRPYLKLRRKMEREQEENVRHELDQEFDSLRDLIYAPDPSSTGSNAIPLGRNRQDAPMPTVAMGNQDVDYDQHVRELAFDKRAKAKDRTKTEEELALEEKEALERAERGRRKRMLGLDEDDSEEEGVKSRGKRKRGGDDLEDSFYDEDTEWNGLGAGLTENSNGEIVKVEPSTSQGEGEDSEEEEEEEEEEEGSSSESEDDTNESGDDVDESEKSEHEAGEHEDIGPIGKGAKGKSKPQNENPPTKELPFTFPCPSTHDEFLEIVDDVEDKDISTVVQRIRALHHTSLAPDNKFKLQACSFVSSCPSPA
jgi:nucleolar protein 14